MSTYTVTDFFVGLMLFLRAAINELAGVTDPVPRCPLPNNFWLLAMAIVVCRSSNCTPFPVASFASLSGLESKKGAVLRRASIDVLVGGASSEPALYSI